MNNQDRPNPKELSPEETLKANSVHGKSSESQPTSNEKDDVKPLSKEEQMAKFEEAMKNEDWGHQPC